VFNAHLQGFANQVESLRSSGRLSGGERGALAEALLAVAGPSGPARVREVLSWLLESVRARWVPAPGAVSPDLDALASFGELAKGEAGDGAAGLSKRHWELFHDVQLTERCLRRSGGDHDPAERLGAESSAVKKTKNGVVGDGGVVPAGISRPVDPPPPLEECPAADHLEWVICLVEALCRATHRAWSPAHAAEASRLGLERALEMSPEENAAHLVHGPAKQFALLGGGLPPESETVSSARSWLRGLRDSAYATVALLAVHAPGAFYPSDAVAAAVSRAAHFDIKSARDRHARALVHTVARPVLSRCPASHRARWHAALTTGLVPHMHERLVSAWARSRREASAAENVFGGVEDGEAAAFAASRGAGGRAAPPPPPPGPPPRFEMLTFFLAVSRC
jgi:exportin-5